MRRKLETTRKIKPEAKARRKNNTFFYLPKLTKEDKNAIKTGDTQSATKIFIKESRQTRRKASTPMIPAARKRTTHKCDKSTGTAFSIIYTAAPLSKTSNSDSAKSAAGKT